MLDKTLQKCLKILYIKTVLQLIHYVHIAFRYLNVIEWVANKRPLSLSLSLSLAHTYKLSTDWSRTRINDNTLKYSHMLYNQALTHTLTHPTITPTQTHTQGTLTHPILTPTITSRPWLYKIPLSLVRFHARTIMKSAKLIRNDIAIWF